MAPEAAWDPLKQSLGSFPWTSPSQAHSPGPCWVKNREEWVLGKQCHLFLLTFTPSQKEHQEAPAWVGGRRYERGTLVFLEPSSWLQPWLPSSVRCPQWDQSQLETATWRFWAESSFGRKNHVVSETWLPGPVHPT